MLPHPPHLHFQPHPKFVALLAVGKLLYHGTFLSVTQYPSTAAPPSNCPYGQFTCYSSGQCVLQSAVCDGRPDCSDSSDEANCGKFISFIPGGIVFMPDLEEALTEDNLLFYVICFIVNLLYALLLKDWRPCSHGEFRCENGPCIPEHQRCDGKHDCPHDISDELDCCKCPADKENVFVCVTPPILIQFTRNQAC